MKTVIVTKPGTVEIGDVPTPAPGPYQALVKTEAACLCNATDAKLIAGHFPGVEKYPLVLGHESAGIVAETGEKVRSFKAGDRAVGGLVFDFGETGLAAGWGGFCEYTLVNDHDAMVADGVADAGHGWLEVFEIQRKVDPDITPEAAVLLCTWREVYGGFGDFNLREGDDILVFGAGPVGLSFVTFAKLLGLGWVGAVDPLENKRAKALEMGADAVFKPDPDELAHLPEGRGKLDAVVDAVGRAGIINTALGLVKPGGSICVYGVVDETTLSVNKAAGPLNFNLYVHQWPTRHREHAAQKPLCDWIRRGRLSPGDYLTHEFPIEQINDAVDAVARGEVVKALLRY